MKLLEKYIGANLPDLGLGNNFIDMIPKAQVTKNKINKMDFNKIKNFCDENDSTNKVKTHMMGKNYL